MNKERRKKIGAIADKLAALQTELEFLHEEEIEYQNNMPENLWGSERYEQSEEASNQLDEICSGLLDIIDSLQELAEG